jgi:hypothetical protein
MNREPLIAEYWDLLRARGIDHLIRPTPSPEEEAKFIAQITEETQRTAAAWGEEDLVAGFADFAAQHRFRREAAPGERPDRHASTAEQIEKAISAMGFELPGPVYVGEYPHNSLNAQARAARNGTLLLINVGLPYLLSEVALAFVSRMVVATRSEDGSFHHQEPTEAMRRRIAESDENLANSLATYLLLTDTSLGGRQPADMTARGIMGYLAARAAITFAVAHEYGHFLAGHLHTPRPTGFLKKTHDQELEADEIGMLLSLRAQEFDEMLSKVSFGKAAAVQGAFLFFAVDHLLNRVRAEMPEFFEQRIVSDHPPSDLRAASLRQTLIELEGPDILQLADALLPIISSHEDRVINALLKLVAG